MKSTKKILFSLGILAITASSCSDSFLDKNPDERVTLTTVDQVVQLLSTAYSQANYGWLAEISSDNITDINAPYYATQSDGKEILVHYNLTSASKGDDEAYKFEAVKSNTSSDSPSTIWEGGYSAVAVANHAIQLLDEMNTADLSSSDKTKLDAAYGEAYLCRAYAHFVLVNMFSQAYKNDEASKNDVGVPYVTEPENKVLVNYDRSNVTETYNKIEKDLLAGLELVSNSNYEKIKWHFNQNAANAFAARFYLYKHNYDKCIEYANKVLGTDSVTTAGMLMDYSGFDECTSSTDYAEVWQSPDAANNLMLIATYSTQWRKEVGYRYACAGPSIRDIIYHLGPNWRWYCMPCAGVGGGTFWDGNSDHGFMNARIAERFEYTDKVAGIGYCHIIRREFTATELLLERAEAYLMKGDVNSAINDMLTYDASRWSFSESNKKFYTNGNALQPLTKALMDSWYECNSGVEKTDTTNLKHSNCIKDWSFLTNMSNNSISVENMKYMNALNDMRRYETAYTGLRFFDLKRWGMTIKHTWGENGKGTDIILEWNDPRRALEVPQEVLAAGMESSQPDQSSSNASSSTSRFTNFTYKK